MHNIINKAAMFFCRIGVAGLAPCAPGTFGSLAALIMAPWLFLPFSLEVQISLLILIFLLGGLAASRAERVCGCKDPSQVVIDELLGQWIAVLPVSLLLYPKLSATINPSEASENCLYAGTLELLATSWPWLLLGFVLFRLFDILKPWPIKASENWLPGGFGIMLDDVIAGLFAGFLVYSAIYKFY